MPPIAAFPGSREEVIPVGNFISGGILATTSLTLGIHDGMQQSTTSGSSTTGHEPDLQYMIGIESMMLRLLQNHQDEMKRFDDTTITKQIQLLMQSRKK